ncbi:MAG TPA: zinc ribbon domain-containing protein [Candidatus Omnitrophota bacterium]|nr:zinc ribbon domain-containing protein [Candidatus Omnitrophota bacterium]HQL41453.1 zinc ribbon domain-containing protein [Candidatus Omnitrophota bacterium]
MPTYDYECSACGYAFEEFQSISEKHLKKCPKCKKSSLHRLLGAGSGVIFKGSGFYETDYKSKSSSGSTKSSTEAPCCATGCPQKQCPSNPANSNKS